MWPQPGLGNLVLRIPLVMLTAIFVAESAIMTAFAVTPGEKLHPWLQVLVDSTVLTLTVAPILYFVIVRPLRVLAEERSQLLAHTFEIQDAERQRLARDLHDEIGQSFTSLMVQLRVLEDAATLELARRKPRNSETLSGQVYDQIRSLARGLHPTVLDDLGLAEAMRRLAEDFEATHGTTVARRCVRPSAGAAGSKGRNNRLPGCAGIAHQLCQARTGHADRNRTTRTTWTVHRLHCR